MKPSRGSLFLIKKTDRFIFHNNERESLRNRGINGVTGLVTSRDVIENIRKERIGGSSTKNSSAASGGIMYMTESQPSQNTGFYIFF